MEVNERNKKLFDKVYQEELDKWIKNCPSMTENEQKSRARGRALLALLSKAIKDKKYIFINTYGQLKKSDVKLYDVLISQHWLTSEIEHPLVIVGFEEGEHSIITTQRPTVDMFNYIEYDIEL